MHRWASNEAVYRRRRRPSCSLASLKGLLCQRRRRRQRQTGRPLPTLLSSPEGKSLGKVLVEIGGDVMELLSLGDFGWRRQRRRCRLWRQWRRRPPSPPSPFNGGGLSFITRWRARYWREIFPLNMQISKGRRRRFSVAISFGKRAFSRANDGLTRK